MRRSHPAATDLSGASDVILQTEGGLQLDAWYLLALAVDAPAVPVASGNGGSRASWAPLARGRAEQGLAVLLLLRSPFMDLPSSGEVHYPLLPVRALLRDDYPVGAARR